MFNLTASGNTTADATMQSVQVQTGTIFAIRFTLAVNDRFKDTQQTTYLNCTYWSKSDKILQHLKKGTALIIQSNWYTNEKSTQSDRYFQEFRVTKIDFQAGKPKEQAPLNVPPEHAANQPQNNNTNNDDDDDLPF